MQEAIDAYRDAEGCTKTDAVRRLVMRGFADWTKERAMIAALRAAHA